MLAGKCHDNCEDDTHILAVYPLKFVCFFNACLLIRVLSSDARGTRPAHGGGGGDLRLPGWDCSADVSDHQHLLLQQRDLPQRAHLQLLWCKFFFFYAASETGKAPTLNICLILRLRFIIRLFYYYRFYVLVDDVEWILGQKVDLSNPPLIFFNRLWTKSDMRVWLTPIRWIQAKN